MCGEECTSISDQRMSKHPLIIFRGFSPDRNDDQNDFHVFFPPFLYQTLNRSWFTRGDQRIRRSNWRSVEPRGGIGCDILSRVFSRAAYVSTRRVQYGKPHYRCHVLGMHREPWSWCFEYTNHSFYEQRWDKGIYWRRWITLIILNTCLN